MWGAAIALRGGVVKITMAFRETEGFACTLWKTKVLLKRQAGLKGLQIRKRRPNGIEISGATYGALFLLQNSQEHLKYASLAADCVLLTEDVRLVLPQAEPRG